MTISQKICGLNHLKKHSKTITQDFLKIPTTSKRSPVKLESDRGAHFYNSIFQIFLKRKNIKHFSRYTDEGPCIAEQVIRTVLNILKKPVCEKGIADWLFELPSVIKKYNNSYHNSIKWTPVQASKKADEKEVYSSLQDRRKKLNPKFILGDLIRTSDIKRVFSKGDSANYSYKITGVIHDTIGTCKINY